MPRAKKSQPVQVAPGETYGDRQQLEAMQAEAPLPDMRATDTGAMFASARGAAEAIEPPPPGGYLRQPPSRPNDPLTAGMGIGAGPGPEVLSMPTGRQDRLRQQLEMAAELTQDPVIARMARTAGRRPIGRALNRSKIR